MKRFIKYLLVGISLALGPSIMSAMDSTCTDPNLASNAIRVVCGHLGVNLYEQTAINILRDNPSITGPELARSCSFPAGMLGDKRNLFKALWNIRRPLIDSCFHQLQDLLTAEDGQGCTLTPKNLLIFRHNRELAIESLQAVSRVTGCPLQIVTREDMDSSMRYVGGGEQLIRDIFENAREAALIQPVAPQQSFITRLLPSFAQRWIYGTSDDSGSRSKPRLRPIICFSNFSELAIRHGYAAITALLEELERNTNVLVIGLHDRGNIDPAILKRGLVIKQDSCNPAPLCNERSAILAACFEQLAGLQLDLMPTIFELAQRTRGFTYGQLLQLMDEIAFEATLSGEPIERGHIIAVYNRTRAEMR